MTACGDEAILLPWLQAYNFFREIRFSIRIQMFGPSSSSTVRGEPYAHAITDLTQFADV